jgi:hypothetical protein
VDVIRAEVVSTFRLLTHTLTAFGDILNCYISCPDIFVTCGERISVTQIALFHDSTACFLLDHFQSFGRKFCFHIHFSAFNTEGKFSAKYS